MVGCLPPLALAPMETAGSSSAPVVFNHLGGGKDESFYVAKFEDVVAAALRSGDMLALNTNEKKIEKNQAVIHFYDAKKDKLQLLIERRSETMTSIKFDVGWFGSLAFSHLMAQQITSELHKSKNFLESWTHNEDN